MKNQTAVTPENVAEQIFTFVNQRPGMEPANYNDWKSYRAEYAGIIRDKREAEALIRYVQLFETSRLYVFNKLTRGERLHIDADGMLDYITGQYFPTEYRAAACRVLASAIWDYWREACGITTYDEIKKQGVKVFGRAIAKRWFN